MVLRSATDHDHTASGWPLLRRGLPPAVSHMLSLAARQARKSVQRDDSKIRWVLGVAVVVLALGLGWALAVPNISCFPCRSAQIEAKRNLKRLYVAEESYRADHDTYAALSDIGFAASSTRDDGGLRYEYAVEDFSREHFRARATAVRDLPRVFSLRRFLSFGCPEVTFSEIEGDTWIVDETRDIRNTADKCE